MTIKINNKVSPKINGYQKVISRLECGNNVCKIKYVVLDTIYFIEDLESNNCHYKRSFGNSYYCICPERINIFEKYEI